MAAKKASLLNVIRAGGEVLVEMPIAPQVVAEWDSLGLPAGKYRQCWRLIPDEPEILLTLEDDCPDHLYCDECGNYTGPDCTCWMVPHPLGTGDDER